ncbi:MAG: hypothetical protein R3B13_31590 [Polyangiaceae bacterium]
MKHSVYFVLMLGLGASAAAVGCSSSDSNGGGGPSAKLGEPGCVAKTDCTACGTCMDSCLCQTGDPAACGVCGGTGTGGLGAGGMGTGSTGAGGVGVAGAAGSSGACTPSAPGAIGATCTGNTECGTAAGAECLTDANGWANGYCTVRGCSDGTCPAASDCFQTTSGSSLCLKTCTQKSDCPCGYACHSAGACVPACQGPQDCEAGEVCSQATGQCEAAPCTTGSCSAGLVCDSASGKCIPDLQQGPPPGPGPTCTLPQRDCTGTDCGTLSAFMPKDGVGFTDYPLNGETPTNQYRSFARKDMQMLVQWAAAYVDCKAKGWTTGNGGAVAFGDMSEADGSIPGTSVGSPGHPAGTHVNGFDMDIGYFQVNTANNYLRPICEHTSGGADQYHCVKPPHLLDLWRTTLFLGALLTSQTIRVIGVDGQVGPLVEAAMPSLCSTGWLPQYSCNKLPYLAYETTNGGAGWFQFHHHHLHVSLNGKPGGGANVWAPDMNLDKGLVPGQESLGSLLDFVGTPGHASVEAGHGGLKRIGTLRGVN